MKTNKVTRTLALVLLTAMLLSMAPLSAMANVTTEYGYLVIADQNIVDRTVMLRPTPGSTDYQEKIKEGWVLRLLDTTNYKGDLWYKVKNPTSSKEGYVKGNYVQLMTTEEISEWQLGGSTQPKPTATPTPTPTAEPQTEKGFLRTTLDGVNLRQTPAGTVLNEKASDKIPEGLVLPYYDEVIQYKGYNWAQIVYNGIPGYIRSDCYTKTDVYGNPIQPTPEETPTPTPTATTTSTPVAGYIRLIVDDVFVRKTPAGDALNYNAKFPLGLVLEYYAITTEKVKGYHWAKVNHLGYNGYIRSDCFEFCDEHGVKIDPPEVTPTPTPTPVPGDPTPVPPPTGPVTYEDGTYGRTNTDKVFFRRTMSTGANAPYWALLPYNWLLQVLGADVDDNGTLWYRVKGGTPTNPGQTYTGYIHGNYLNIVTGGNPEGYVPATESNYAVVQVNGINLRDGIGGNSITALLSNTVVNIIERPTGVHADWFIIEHDGDFGYVEAYALRILDNDELSNFVLPPTPAPTATPTATPAYTGTGYIKIIANKVNIRKTPGGTSLTPRDDQKLPLGLVLPYSEGPTEKISGYYWVKVTVGDITGYVRSDCYVQCDMAGNVPTSVPTPTPTSDPGSSDLTYIRLIKGGVNLRVSPWGTSITQLNKGTVLPYLGTKMNGSEAWYEVYYADKGTYGFILSTMAVFSDAAGNAIVITPTPTSTATGAPDITGYVATLKTSVWVRAAAKTDADTVGKVANKGTVLQQIGAKVMPLGSSYAWYPIQLSDGTRGYIRSDMVFELATWQLDYYLLHGTCPTPTPGPATPKPGNSEYIITTSDKLWIRQEPSKVAATMGQLSLGTVMRFYGKQTENKGNGSTVTWYKIMVDNKTGWLHGDFVRVLTNAEYAAYLNENPAAATPSPTPLPDLNKLTDVAFTTLDRVKIRNAPSMSGVESRLVYDANTKVTYLKEYKLNVPAPDGNTYNWFKIKYSGVTGWMRGDCIRILTEDEKAMYDLAGDPDAAPEASYSTLSLNSTGEEVTRLQQKLVEKGYLAASEVSGIYLTSTEQAVIAFQRANKNLVVDGIAGEKTQHALFGTVPVGTYDGSSTTVTLYPVEKVDWYSGGIRQLWKVGEVAVVTDVYTGISFKAQHLYGDNHADCEPLTRADTAAICQIYKVNNPQEIDDYEQQLQSYKRRPLWVTLKGRTFAASMYGIPHNFDGDRIPDNGYNGQFCIHFTNSMTHGNASNPAHVDHSAAINGWFGHQEAIQYAYEHSQSGKK